MDADLPYSKLNVDVQPFVPRHSIPQLGIVSEKERSSDFSALRVRSRQSFVDKRGDVSQTWRNGQSKPVSTQKKTESGGRISESRHLTADSANAAEKITHSFPVIKSGSRSSVSGQFRDNKRNTTNSPRATNHFDRSSADNRRSGKGGLNLLTSADIRHTPENTLKLETDFPELLQNALSPKSPTTSAGWGRSFADIIKEQPTPKEQPAVIEQPAADNLKSLAIHQNDQKVNRQLKLRNFERVAPVSRAGVFQTEALLNCRPLSTEASVPLTAKQLVSDPAFSQNTSKENTNNGADSRKSDDQVASSISAEPNVVMSSVAEHVTPTSEPDVVVSSVAEHVMPTSEPVSSISNPWRNSRNVLADVSRLPREDLKERRVSYQPVESTSTNNVWTSRMKASTTTTKTAKEFVQAPRVVEKPTENITDSKPETPEVMAVPKRKRKTEGQLKKEFKNKLRSLPSVQGKVLTITRDFHDMYNRGEGTKACSTDDGAEFLLEEFPALGADPRPCRPDNDEVLPTVVPPLDSDDGWSDLETDASVSKSRATLVKTDAEFPTLAPSSKTTTARLSAKPTASAASASPVKSSKKPKARSVMQLDLTQMIISKKSIPTEVEATVASRGGGQKLHKVKPVVANILDSSAPRRRGKEREIPSKKKLTAMKKIILRERLERRTGRLAAVQSVEPPVDEIEKLILVDATETADNPAPTVDFGETLISDIKTESIAAETEPAWKDISCSEIGIEIDSCQISVSQAKFPSIETFPVEPAQLDVSQDEFAQSCSTQSASDSQSASQMELIHSAILNSKSSPVLDAPAKRTIHNRRFREYCDQILDPEIDELVTKMLQDLIRFHDRVYQKDPVKAKMRRRMVIGIREVTKHLKLKKIKFLVLAPNVEKIKSSGGLDDAMNTVIALAREQNVPFVFALGRRKLGYVCLKKVPVSIVGVFNYDGTENYFKQLCTLAESGSEAYHQAVERVATPE